MTTTFIGIDLAWRSQRNSSGIAVLRGDRKGALLEVSQTLGPGEPVEDFVAANATPSTVVAIDAPLIIINAKGQRGCETAIGRKYGARDASCHTSNLQLYREAPSVRLTSELLRQGFEHPDPTSEQLPDRVVLEVYPHAAMVELWNLKKIIKYKKGSAATKRQGLKELQSRLKLLCNSEPALYSAGMLMELLQQSLNGLVGREAKKYEDRLDALFCGYLAYYFWYWGWPKNEMFGDTQSGYILNPKLPPLGASKDVGVPKGKTSTLLPRAPSASQGLAGETTGSEPDTWNLGPETYPALIELGHQLARPFRPSEDCTAASVASVIVSRSGEAFSGVCLDFACSLGFCAEHAAIAEMLKRHESEIAMIVAVDEHGKVLAPCGRCREMMWQLDPANKDALVILAPDHARPLRELLPER